MPYSCPSIAGAAIGRAAPWPKMRTAASPSRRARPEVAGEERLQRAEEGDQVGLLLLGEADAEPRVVEVDDLAEVRGRAVVEVRRTGRDRAEHRALELANVAPEAGDQRAARVGRLLDLVGRLVAQGVEWHVGGA